MCIGKVLSEQPVCTLLSAPTDRNTKTIEINNALLLCYSALLGFSRSIVSSLIDRHDIVCSFQLRPIAIETRHSAETRTHFHHRRGRVSGYTIECLGNAVILVVEHVSAVRRITLSFSLFICLR